MQNTIQAALNKIGLVGSPYHRKLIAIGKTFQKLSEQLQSLKQDINSSRDRQLVESTYRTLERKLRKVAEIYCPDPQDKGKWLQAANDCRITANNLAKLPTRLVEQESQRFEEIVASCRKGVIDLLTAFPPVNLSEHDHHNFAKGIERCCGRMHGATSGHAVGRKFSEFVESCLGLR